MRTSEIDVERSEGVPVGKRLLLGERGVLAGGRYVEKHVAQLEREGYSASEIDFQTGTEVTVKLFFTNARTGCGSIVVVELQHAHSAENIGSKAGVVPQIDFHIATPALVAHIGGFNMGGQIVSGRPTYIVEGGFEIETALVVTTELKNRTETETYASTIGSGVAQVEVGVPHGVAQRGTNDEVDIANLGICARCTERKQQSCYGK